ncbi:hypothetical protein Taro_047465 [Colocasia esculenta]|uniref:Uncharacterized protein n=1 Tax=Colocasia esculenta TaxID=4460 RepID=A0A843WVH1_COLES|nr:hypothetical protein [Colocasia esculenta]
MWTSVWVNVKGACRQPVVGGHRCCRLHGIRGQQTVKRGLMGQRTMRGWAKSCVYKCPSETSDLAREQSGLKGWCLGKQRTRRFDERPSPRVGILASQPNELG